MPDAIVPIYEASQAALDEILATDKLYHQLNSLVLSGNSTNDRKSIMEICNDVWIKHAEAVPSQAWYGRMLFRHISNMLSSLGEVQTIYTILRLFPDDLSEVRVILNKNGIYPSYAFLKVVSSRSTEPVLPRRSTYVMNFADSDKHMYRQSNGRMEFKVLPGRGENTWVSYDLLIPSSVSMRWSGVVMKPSFVMTNGKGRGTVPYGVEPESVKKTNTVIGVDLGVIHPFAARAVHSNGDYEQLHIPSKSLMRVRSKLTALETELKLLRSRSRQTADYINSGGIGANEDRQSQRYVRQRHLEKKITRVKEDLSHLVASEIVYLAKESGADTIKLENLKAINKGGKGWFYGMMGDAINSAAEVAGLRVVYVDPKYTSQMNPVTKEIRKAGTDRLVRFSDGLVIDRDDLATLNIAIRPAIGRRGKPIRINLRKKHTSTPKQIKRKTSRRSERQQLVNSVRSQSNATVNERERLAVVSRPWEAASITPSGRIYASPWGVSDTSKSLLLSRHVNPRFSLELQDLTSFARK